MCGPQECVQSTGPGELVLSNPSKRHLMQMSGFQHELFHSADPSYNAALLVVQSPSLRSLQAAWTEMISCFPFTTGLQLVLTFTSIQLPLWKSYKKEVHFSIKCKPNISRQLTHSENKSPGCGNKNENQYLIDL